MNHFLKHKSQVKKMDMLAIDMVPECLQTAGTLTKGQEFAFKYIIDMYITYILNSLYILDNTVAGKYICCPGKYS